MNRYSGFSIKKYAAILCAMGIVFHCFISTASATGAGGIKSEADAKFKLNEIADVISEPFWELNDHTLEVIIGTYLKSGGFTALQIYHSAAESKVVLTGKIKENKEIDFLWGPSHLNDFSSFKAVQLPIPHGEDTIGKIV
ncbi:MAG: hypothetical protein MI802_22555, partial [Desulfobacterales bacterium]|nr:hypothetical protein [Desulfobacterales bacterium]